MLLERQCMRWMCLFRQEYGAASGMAKSSFDLSIVKSCHRWKLPVRDYLAAVLPVLADRRIQSLPDITPTAWGAQHS
jgi:hypothetical protein